MTSGSGYAIVGRTENLTLDPLNPSPSLLCKLGSILIHAEEGLSVKGHPFDIHALRQLIEDQEVIEWREAMDALALLPVKR